MGIESKLEIDMHVVDNHIKLALIKSIHAAVWVFFNIVLVYLYYSVLTNQIGVLFWLGVVAYAVEFGILLFYGWNCPITFWARQYSDSQKDNFDIYLPNWLARYNKIIFTTIFLIGFVMVLVRKYF